MANSVFTPSPILEPQFIGPAAAPLVFQPNAGGSSVPANFTYQINSCNVSNVSGAPVSLTVWRVPAGSAADNQHLRVPATVIVPAATSSVPWVEMTILEGINLMAGDAVWAAAGAANALVIDADGTVIQ
jgi:hypothetical protein